MKTKIKTIRRKWYVLYTNAPATVTTSINGVEYTLASTHTAGVEVFPVAEDSVSVETEGDCFLFPTESVQSSLCTENMVTPVSQQGASNVTFGRAVWHCLAVDCTSCEVKPAQKERRAYTIQLLLNPSVDMPTGWLTSADPALPVYWPYGEPMLVSGYRYAVTLVQLPHAIIANMTPLGLNPSA